MTNKLDKLDKLIENVIKDINKAMPCATTKEIQEDIDNTYKEILEKHLYWLI